MVTTVVMLMIMVMVCGGRLHNRNIVPIRLHPIYSWQQMLFCWNFNSRVLKAYIYSNISFVVFELFFKCAILVLSCMHKYSIFV